MRLLMYAFEGKNGIAASQNDTFHGLLEGQNGYPGDLDSLLAAGSDLVAVGKQLLAAPQIDMQAIRFLPPVQKPGKILCVGLNYADHSAETGFTQPDYPTVFCRFATSLTAHKAPIIKPSVSDHLDFEGEMVAVIGKGGRNISKEQALEHVAAYSIFNDASIRDYQFRTPQWTVGKNFDHTGAFGPWLVTPDALPQGAKGLAIETRLNGKVVQQSNTKYMMFDVATQISLLSEVMTLCPGDIFITGTPAGVGVSRTPQLFMKVGDVCEVSIEGIGVLHNVVAGDR